MANETPTPTVPSNVLAKLFNLTDVRIQQLAKMGVCVKAAHGRYDLWASIKGYVKYLQDRAVGRGVEGGSDDQSEYQKYRAKLYQARAQKEAAQAALIVGKAHDAEIIETVWGDMITTTKTKILAIPTKAAGRVQSVLPLPAVEAILREHCMEALNALAEYDPSNLVDEFVKKEKPSEPESDLENEEDAAE